jgi:hypothetical protein
LSEGDIATVVTKDEAANIASIENGNLIIFNRFDDSIMLGYYIKSAREC